jgi:hypothetical protein
MLSATMSSADRKSARMIPPACIQPRLLGVPDTLRSRRTIGDSRAGTWTPAGANECATRCYPRAFLLALIIAMSKA